jgi:hypothetical protein
VGRHKNNLIATGTLKHGLFSAYLQASRVTAKMQKIMKDILTIERLEC